MDSRRAPPTFAQNAYICQGLCSACRRLLNQCRQSRSPGQQSEILIGAKLPRAAGPEASLERGAGDSKLYPLTRLAGVATDKVVLPKDSGAPECYDGISIYTFEFMQNPKLFARQFPTSNTELLHSLRKMFERRPPLGSLSVPGAGRLQMRFEYLKISWRNQRIRSWASCLLRPSDSCGQPSPRHLTQLVSILRVPICRFRWRLFLSKRAVWFLPVGLELMEAPWRALCSHAGKSGDWKCAPK